MLRTPKETSTKAVLSQPNTSRKVVPQNLKITESCLEIDQIFLQLPSNHTVAVVLSYVDFESEVAKLLLSLSKRSSEYFKVN